MLKSVKTKFGEYIIYFTLYSVLGWIYEVVLETFIYGWGFSNRGVLFGPYCPIYGVGALLFIFTVDPLIRGKEIYKRLKYIPVVFVLCMVIATVVELAGSYILEFFTGGWPWQTYENYAVNFQGRIALSTSIRFGIGGVIVLYIFQPVLEKIIGRMKRSAVNITAYVLLFIFAADIIFTLFIRK